MTLQAAGVLSLTACFTFIDFDLDDGGGGTGGVPGTGGAGAGGNLPAGGDGPTGGNPPDCTGCATKCVEGLCQAEVIFTADASIALLAAGGNRVALIDDTTGGNSVSFVNANTGTLTKQMNGAPGEPWDFVGSLMVTPQGVGYYSPQAANSDQPVQECDPVGTDCALSFSVPGGASHLNGLTYADGFIFGIAADSGNVWSAQATDPAAGVAFALYTQAGSAVQAAHNVAIRGNRVLASSLGLPALGPPCLGIGEANLLLEQNIGEPLTCQQLAPQYRQINFPVIASGGALFARVIAGEKPPYKGLTLKFSPDGTINNNFPHVAVTLPDINSSPGGIATDASHVYFFGDLQGVRLVQCDIDGLSDSCKPASDSFAGLSLLTENEEFVFFSVGPVLYRFRKTGP